MRTIIFSDGKSAAKLWQDGKTLTNGYVTGLHMKVGEAPHIAVTTFGDQEWVESEKPAPADTGVRFEGWAFILPEPRIQRVTRWITLQKPTWIEIPPLLRDFTPKITYTRI